jgi:hypothetical protein
MEEISRICDKILAKKPQDPKILLTKMVSIIKSGKLSLGEAYFKKHNPGKDLDLLYCYCYYLYKSQKYSEFVTFIDTQSEI